MKKSFVTNEKVHFYGEREGSLVRRPSLKNNLLVYLLFIIQLYALSQRVFLVQWFETIERTRKSRSLGISFTVVSISLDVHFVNLLYTLFIRMLFFTRIFFFLPIT